MDLAAIKARAERATEGPWEVRIAGVEGDSFVAATGPWCRIRDGNGYGKAEEDRVEEDAIFIAAAREDIPALLRAVEVLQERIVFAIEHCQECDGGGGCEQCDANIKALADAGLEG